MVNERPVVSVNVHVSRLVVLVFVQENREMSPHTTNVTACHSSSDCCRITQPNYSEMKILMVKAHEPEIKVRGQLGLMSLQLIICYITVARKH